MAVRDLNSPVPVAVLIPVYNRQDGLDRSCASIPTSAACDVIIVDDGSHPAITRPLSLDPNRVTLLRLPENRGVNHALNRGLAWILERNYKYVARLDAGDAMLPNRLDRQLAFLDSHPDHAIVGGQVRFVDLQHREVLRDNFPTADDAIRRAMHGRACIMGAAMTIRVAALREAGVFDEHFPNAEDFELSWRLLKSWKGANLPEPVVQCELNPDGLSLAGRSQQVRLRIRVLLKYFEPRVPESYVGLFKNLALLVVPYRCVCWLKRRYVRPERGWL